MSRWLQADVVNSDDIGFKVEELTKDVMDNYEDNDGVEVSSYDAELKMEAEDRINNNYKYLKDNLNNIDDPDLRKKVEDALKYTDECKEMVNSK